ncbi:hypothetical protein [Viridibacillus arvi]|uniref:hypothetical protein n=1 Tax=Viridibacillus arvi TaxID=263475 RepID=UPI0034CF9EB9
MVSSAPTVEYEIENDYECIPKITIDLNELLKRELLNYLQATAKSDNKDLID